MEYLRYDIDFPAVHENMKKLFFVETHSHRKLCQSLYDTSKLNQTIALLKSSGCGVTCSLKKFVNQHKKDCRNYYISPSKNGMKNSLCSILYSMGYDFRPKYLFGSSQFEFLVSAVKYHFKKVEKKESHLVIIDDSHFLKGIEFRKLTYFLTELRDHSSFAVVTTEKHLKKINSRVDINSESKEFIDTIAGYCRILIPHREERCEMCHRFGIRDQRLIDLLANESPNLKSLTRHFRRISKEACKQQEKN